MADGKNAPDETGLGALSDTYEIVGELRGMDTAYRYGGEEFAVILPATLGSDACIVAERIRAAIASAHVSGVDQPLSPHLTRQRLCHLHDRREVELIAGHADGGCCRAHGFPLLQ